MASLFGAMFARALSRKGLSQRDFARAVGRTGVFISLVARERRRVPLKDLDRWLNVLDLPRRDSQRLRLQALLGHCPDEIRTLVATLLRRPRRRRRRPSSRSGD